MTTWTPEERMEGATSTTYDDANLTYDAVNYNYNGQVIPVWTNELTS
jgi:hypothetical protein